MFEFERTPLIAKKSLGQHFLNNTHIPTRMAEAGNVAQGDIVVEIGPGTGVLTKALLATGATVIAIETDPRAIHILSDIFADEIMTKRLIILDTDVRALSIASLGLRAGGYKVVANIPYYLSGMLFRMFLENETYPSDLVFLVQKEVAERVCRDPKESILSLSVKVFGEPKYIKTIGRGNFTPPPKVDSAIIAVSHVSHNALTEIGVPFFFHILHTGFKAKRKQLLGNLSSLYPRAVLLLLFSELNINPTVRAEDVSLSSWLQICEKLKSVSMHTEPYE